jgi:hypothetical protein
VLIGVMAADGRGALSSVAQRLYWAATVAAAVLLPSFMLVAILIQVADPGNRRYDDDPDLSRLIPVVRREAEGQPILVLSSNMASGFPLTTYAGADWGMRFPSLWLLVAAYQQQLRRSEPLAYRPPERRSGLERVMSNGVVEDFVASRPKLLLVLSHGVDRPRSGVRRIDYLRYFRMDPRFESAFRDYGFLQDVGQYRIFVRAGGGAGAGGEVPPPPRTGVGSREILPGLQLVGLETRSVIQGAVFLAAIASLYRRRRRRGWA